MNKRSVAVLLMMAVAALWMPMHAWGQDTVESIQKDVVAKWEKVTSCSAIIAGSGDVKISAQMPTPLHLVGSGSVDFMKQASGACSRLELGAGLTPQAKPMGRILFVSNGPDAFIETEFIGKVQAKKVDGIPIAAGGQELFNVMNQHLTLTAMPSEKVGEVDAYVLAGELKVPDASIPVSKLLVYFAKDTGVVLKAVALDTEGKPMVTLAMQDIKLNQPIAANKFMYTLPETAPAAQSTAAAPTAAKSTAAAPATDAKPAATETKAAPAKK